MRTHLVRLPLGIAVVGLLAGLGVQPVQGGKKAAAAATATAYAPVVAALQQTRVLLQSANHDYDGYRAKAMHDIGKAMHALDPSHKHKLPKIAVAAVHEDQTISDKQLAQANKQLQTVVNQITSGPATAHTTSAVAHLGTAMGHLNTALKIK